MDGFFLWSEKSGDYMETAIRKVNVNVESDLSIVRDDIEKLTNQIEQLADTINNLNENGVNVKINIKADTDTLFKRLVRVFK